METRKCCNFLNLRLGSEKAALPWFHEMDSKLPVAATFPQRSLSLPFRYM